MAEGLKAMMLEGFGVAFLPESLVRAEAQSGRAVRAGDENQDLVLEIRLYLSLKNRRPWVESVWNAAEPV